MASGRERASSTHVIQFCRTDDYGTGRLAAFVREGLDRDEDVLVVATPERIAAVDQALRSLTTPFDPAIAAERLMCLEVAPMVDAIVVDGRIDRARIAERLQPFLALSTRPKRAYGEMATLLIARGQLDAAIALERFGTELARDFGVRILCGYDVAQLGDGPDDSMQHIVCCHDGIHVESTIDAAPTPSVDPSKITVLLADDYEDARELFGEYLEFQGYRVVLAADGVEALNMARQICPDIMLLDIRMPRMTGTEVMRALKADPTFAGVPIIALTAHALHNERAAMIAEGFDAVVTKPCLPDDLARTVAAIVALHRRDAAL